TTPLWQRALPWAIAAIAVAAAIGVAVIQRPAPPAAAPAVMRSRASFKDIAGFVALSADGRKLVYTSTVEGGFILSLRKLDEFEARALPGSNAGVFPVFSPDGGWIAFSTNTDPPIVKKMPVDGGTPITLCNGNFGLGAAWGPDDTIVFPAGRGLMR